VLRWAAAAAAVLLVGLTVWNLVPGGGPADLNDLLARYAAAEEGERARLQERIHALGPNAIPDIVAALEDPSVQVQIGAARALKTFRDGLVVELLLEMKERQAPASGEIVLLEDLGFEESDYELIDVAFDMARDEAMVEEAADVLRKIDRGGYNRDARVRITRKLADLLKNPDVRVQKTALELVKLLEIGFPVRDLVEFLDHPVLWKSALQILRQASGEEFGRDKKVWNEYFRRRGKIY
jgi:HEAT repeat protein